MRKMLAVLCVSGSILGLSACGSTHVVYPGLPSASETLIDEKALFIAEAAYSGLTTLALEAVNTGALKGEQAARVQVLNRQAYQSLVLARHAQATANSRSYTEQVTRALDLIAQAQALIRPRE